MKERDLMHRPVLLNEVVESLNIKENGRYIDGTLGLGGHAEAILRQLGPDGALLGLDVDPENLKQAEDRLQPFEEKTITRRVNFRGLQEVLHELKWATVDGMIFDLGVSSTQLDQASRGFSFLHSGPLDMRLNPDSPETALSILQKISEEDLVETFKQFGEHRQAKRVSRYLLHDIAAGRIQTTEDLAGFCMRVLGRRGKSHPATRIFLALRNLVNGELASLKELLNVAPNFLSIKGRLAVISFHSLEDKEIKNRFRALVKEGINGMEFSSVNKKPIIPTSEEIKGNPRARSAKLRVLERVT